MPKKHPPSANIATVGARLTFDEIERVDSAARAAHLDRASFIRRTLLLRVIRFYPAEVLLAEGIALFAHMRVSVELNRVERLDDAFGKLDRILDRLERLSVREPIR